MSSHRIGSKLQTNFQFPAEGVFETKSELQKQKMHDMRGVGDLKQQKKKQTNN